MQITNTNELIGYEGESYSREITFTVEETLQDCDIYFEFEKPDGYKCMSAEPIDITDSYLLPATLLDEVGYLKIQMVAYRGNNFVQKNGVRKFYITQSINAADALINDDGNVNILIELQKTKADDISYNENVLQLMADGEPIGTPIIIGGGGVSDYNDLENQPITIITNLDRDNPVNLRNLDSGLYRFQGYFKPYETFTGRFTVPAPLFVSIYRQSSKTSMQMYFAYQNQVQFYEMTDEDYTTKNAKLSEMVDKIADLEARVTALENA